MKDSNTTQKALEFLMDKQVKFSENLSLDKEEDLIRRHKRAMQYASYALNNSEKRALSFDIKDTLVSFNSLVDFVVTVSC